ncbi:hypothetical protein TNCV_4485111 [Trichonephila clavipes]|nr:hypothetical protein TNCV_4485111 [Trichonephila clavipes]
MHRCPTRRVFSSTGLELMTRQATIRYLYHLATAATQWSWDEKEECSVQINYARQLEIIGNVKETHPKDSKGRLEIRPCCGGWAFN